jgi:hypothetical protein
METTIDKKHLTRGDFFIEDEKPVWRESSTGEFYLYKSPGRIEFINSDEMVEGDTVVKVRTHGKNI